MPRVKGDDTLTWKLNRYGVFDVCSYYNFLAVPDGSPSISFPWKCIWSIKVPKRVSFFLWTTARSSILTIDNLVQRCLPLVNWCCMCQCDEEIVDHLLLHCKFAYVLWSEVFLIFGIQWVMSKAIASLLFGWWNWLRKHSSNIWNMVLACLMWLIWRERNNRTFEDIVRSVDLLKSTLVETLFIFIF